MQYLLTAEEYTALLNANKKAAETAKETLQALCTEVANLKPIEVPWAKDMKPEPWGCYLSEDGPEYCDCCPVKDVCPCDHKSWSK